MNRLCATFLCSIALVGCTFTELTPPPIGQEYIRLAATGDADLTIAPVVLQGPAKLGHQFVFIVLPAGTISAGQPGRLVESALFRAAARAGYRPILASPNGELSVESATVEITAYDLFFIRYLRSSVTITFRWQGEDMSRSVSHAGGKFRFFGFKPQLESLLFATLDEAGDTILDSKPSTSRRG